MTKKIFFFFGFIIISVVATLLLFSIIEGFSSLYMALNKVPPAKQVAESAHTEYDPILGWINLPNVERKNHYGPGRHVKINAQGFRGDLDHDIESPKDKLRVICSGDSFTMGYGVNNQNTWPAHLNKLAPNLEVINMGQGGYGVDQSYLWYKRDGLKIKHQVHLFAFFIGDFHRMSLKVFNGYPKPYLALEKGNLVTKNVPVPKRSKLKTGIARYTAALRELRISQLIGRGQPKKQGKSGPKPVYPLESPKIVELIGSVFGDLQKISKKKDISLVAVWLPFEREYRRKNYDHFRFKVKKALEEQGVEMIDLVPPLRTMPAKKVKSMFIQKDIKNYVGSKGHYTAKGNQVIAKLIHKRLKALLPSAPLGDKPLAFNTP